LSIRLGGVPIRTRVRKWGNSLALRIPKPFALEVSLSDDSVVDIKVVNGRLVVSCVPEAAAGKPADLSVPEPGTKPDHG
jgi:antitoxin component of MazEF toxin-antitoxin module